LLLLGVLHVHALYALMPSLQHAPTIGASALQMKALTPHVVLFFALAGMTSHRLGEKPLQSVLHRSLLLLVIGAATHVAGTVVEHVLWLPWSGWYPVLRDIGKPLLLGTGLLSLGWFFVTLAVVRLFAFAWARSFAVFALAAATVAALLVAAWALGLPNNLYEWRNWPAAFVAFLIGQRLPRDVSVPHSVGALCVVAGMVLPLMNHPTIPDDGLCLSCHPEFIAYPTVGAFGFAPFYLLHELLALVGLLWLVRQVGSTRFGRMLGWFGRRSLALLMLHGCIASALYGLYKAIDPALDGLPFFVVVLVGNPLAHALAYGLLGAPIEGFVALCSRAARRVVAIPPRPMIRRA
jgi:hypothetical protein